MSGEKNEKKKEKNINLKLFFQCGDERDFDVDSKDIAIEFIANEVNEGFFNFKDNDEGDSTFYPFHSLLKFKLFNKKKKKK